MLLIKEKEEKIKKEKQNLFVVIRGYKNNVKQNKTRKEMRYKEKN